MGWKTLDDLALASKRVLVRVDINVPVDNGVVTDDTRIQRIVPTITDILNAGGLPILLAHFGRPKGEVKQEFSLKQLQPTLAEAFGTKVSFAPDCVGSTAEAAIKSAAAGSVVLLENTRFHAAETKNDAKFAAEIAKLGDIYVNDAFSAAHRAHASTEALARLLPSAAGRLMATELAALEAALGQPDRPVAAVVGGAKVSTKLDLLGNLCRKVDYLIIGGGMANTFLVAKGIDVGKSLAEHDMADTARTIMKAADEAGCTIVLPDDIVVAPEFSADATATTLPADACPPDQMILDAGPKTVAKISQILDDCKTLVWNGPLGAFELAPFAKATNAAARKAAQATQAGNLRSVAGGGDTVAALNQAGVADQFSYISTAGGAFLEWMEGKTLPGVAALENSGQ